MFGLSRLFGGPPPVVEPAPPPLNQILVDEDLVGSFTQPDVTLEAAVNTALRAHLLHERNAAEAALRGEKLPFWLRRDDTDRGDMEDELRDRVTQRRAGEAAG